MNTVSIYKSEYESDAKYRKAYQELVKHYECKVKVDDGNGGTGWKFFESRQDMQTWKKQR